MEKDSITNYQNTQTALTPAQRNANNWVANFDALWTRLAARNANDAIRTSLPALREYPALLGDGVAYASIKVWLSLILTEVTQYFNVGKNMNRTQILMTADIIAEEYSHFSLADFKACFRRAMCSRKLYDRLDGNIICGWLAEYEEEREIEIQKLYEQQDREQYQPPALTDGISMDEYAEKVRARAVSGDTDAEEELARIEDFKSLIQQSPRGDRRKEIEFRRRYLTEYLKTKKSNDRIGT